MRTTVTCYLSSWRHPRRRLGAGIQPSQDTARGTGVSDLHVRSSDSKLVMKGLLDVPPGRRLHHQNAVIENRLITATKEMDLAPGRTGQTVLAVGGGVILPGPARGAHSREDRGTRFHRQHHRVRRAHEGPCLLPEEVLDSRVQPVEVTPLNDPVFYRTSSRASTRASTCGGNVSRGTRSLDGRLILDSLPRTPSRACSCPSPSSRAAPALELGADRRGSAR